MVVSPPQPAIADPTTPLRVRNHGDLFTRSLSTVHFEYVEELYGQWPSPVCIIADGPYGLNGFPGDLPTVDGLVDWYRPHVKGVVGQVDARTTLWFWNSELGWATIHPLLLEHGWEYRSCHIWDKGPRAYSGKRQHSNVEEVSSHDGGLCTIRQASTVSLQRPMAHHARLATC